MATVKLTKNQKDALENLKQHGRLFVGFYSPNIMRTFQSLVNKGMAREDQYSVYGIYFVAA